MMTYYVEKDGKIVLFDSDREAVQNSLACMPQYAGLAIQETQRPIADFQFADTPQYIAAQEQAAAQQVRADLQQQLAQLDQKTIRPLRAISSGVGSVQDQETLQALEAQAAQLREQLRELL